jgi:flagellar hook-associated protein 1 FlgK
VAEIAEQMPTRSTTQLAPASPWPAPPGKPLFVFNPAAPPNMLQVTSGFQTADLAFSSDGTPGDSGNLQKLVDIKGQPITLTTSGSVLLGDADTQLVGKLGIDSQQNQAPQHRQTMRQQSEDDWQSTSGVNQDEEASTWSNTRICTRPT